MDLVYGLWWKTFFPIQCANEKMLSSDHGIQLLVTNIKVYFGCYTANVNRQTTDKLLVSYAIITGENV